MKQIVNTLNDHQRNFHVTRKVDLFWYVQKLTEVEMLSYRLEGHCNDVLKKYMNNLEITIGQRLNRDEKFLNDYTKKIKP